MVKHLWSCVIVLLLKKVHKFKLTPLSNGNIKHQNTEMTLAAFNELMKNKHGCQALPLIERQMMPYGVDNTAKYQAFFDYAGNFEQEEEMTPQEHSSSQNFQI